MTLRSTDARRLADRYDRAAPGWVRAMARLGYDAAYRQIAAHVLAQAPSGRDGGTPLRVLDAGCGAGDFTRAFAHQASAPVAVDLVDVSPAMLACAEEALAGLAVEALPIRASLDEAPLAAGGYDFALCAHLLEHVARPETTLARLHAALRPGGTLLLVANQPHWCTRLIQLRWRTAAFAPTRVEAWLSAAGFGSVERIAFANGPPSRTSMGYVARRNIVSDCDRP